MAEERSRDTSTCEARNYACCEADNTPADEREGDDGYDRHVTAWEARARA